MFRSLISILAMVCMISECIAEVSNNCRSEKILFNDEWEFMIDTAGFTAPGQFNKKEGTVPWVNVSLPHTPRIEPLVVNDQWQGICWYRKTFTAPESWAGKKVFIRFEGTMNAAELWINGERKITHLGGYLPFVADITGDILEESENSVHVKLNNEDNPLTGPKPLKNLDFNMYGGLYRDAFLIIKDPVHITDEQFADKVAGGGIFVTYPFVSSDRAVVSVKTNIMNSGDRVARIKVKHLLKHDGHILSSCSASYIVDPGNDTDSDQELEVSGPMLWSPESPWLYILETVLMQDDRILDRQVTRIGIRKFEFHDNRLFINGKESYLRGINHHQEYPYIGYALSNNAQFRDAGKIKEAGFDYVRLSHYPHSQAFMNACDELGIVVLDAIPGWQYFNNDSRFQSHVLQTARDMIRRDRNHPSVLAWEVSLNESWMPEPFIDSLVKIAHEEYPGENCYAAGWQKHGFDIFIQARQHRIGHPEKLPDRPYIVSEYGDWEYYAMNAGLNQDAWGELLVEERSSRQLLGSGEKRLLQQTLNIQEAHNDNFNTPAVADSYWVMFDYNRGYADDLEASGIMSIFRLPKFSYHFFRSQRDPGETVFGKPSGPMVFIASYCDEKSPPGLRVYSNCDAIELFYNGKSLGKAEPGINRISNHLKHPPFTFDTVPEGPGDYTAIGYIAGKKVASHKIITAGKPSKILIEVDLTGKALGKGCNDIVFVRAIITDQNNQVVNNNNVEVTFEISGNGRIIGPDRAKAEAGRATVLVMAGNSTGDIVLSASADGMVSEPFRIKVGD